MAQLDQNRAPESDSLKRWTTRIGLTVAGVIGGSLLLEKATGFAVLQFVPIVHDVQFIMLTIIAGALGGLFGGVSILACLSARAGRFTLASGLMLLCGGLGLSWAIPEITHAQEAFTQNGQPLVDALAYFGFTMIWSIILVVMGVIMFFIGRNVEGGNAREKAPR